MINREDYGNIINRRKISLNSIRKENNNLLKNCINLNLKMTKIKNINRQKTQTSENTFFNLYKSISSNNTINKNLITKENNKLVSHRKIEYNQEPNRSIRLKKNKSINLETKLISNCNQKDFNQRQLFNDKDNKNNKKNYLSTTLRTSKKYKSKNKLNTYYFPLIQNLSKENDFQEKYITNKTPNIFKTEPNNSINNINSNEYRKRIESKFNNTINTIYHPLLKIEKNLDQNNNELLLFNTNKLLIQDEKHKDRIKLNIKKITNNKATITEKKIIKTDENDFSLNKFIRLNNKNLSENKNKNRLLMGRNINNKIIKGSFSIGKYLFGQDKNRNFDKCNTYRSKIYSKGKNAKNSENDINGRKYETILTDDKGRILETNNGNQKNFNLFDILPLN